MHAMTFTWSAPEDAVFAQEAWDDSIGHTMPVYGPRGVATGTLVGAVVKEDGFRVDLTVEVPDEFAAALGGEVAPVAVDYRDPVDDSRRSARIDSPLDTQACPDCGEVLPWKCCRHRRDN